MATNKTAATWFYLYLQQRSLSEHCLQEDRKEWRATKVDTTAITQASNHDGLLQGERVEMGDQGGCYCRNTGKRSCVLLQGEIVETGRSYWTRDRIPPVNGRQ